MPASPWMLALFCLTLTAAARAEFEGLTTQELQALLQELDYEKQMLNSDSGADYPEYYEEEAEQEGNHINDAIAEAEERRLREPETVAHAAMVNGPLLRPVPAVPIGQDQQQQQETNSVTQQQQANGAASSSASSSVLPAYCDPPNPCPIGYTKDDGCIEDFENTSDFSRNYQDRQNCLCDSEHMFNCPTEPKEKQPDSLLELAPFGAGDANDAFLSGAKLHVAAKKGLGF